tara:strand:- start:413 stop:874 length:462 start_codon:yes stop_codon:yes gene_type:complete
VKKLATIVNAIDQTQMAFYMTKELNKTLDDIKYAPICFYNVLSHPPITPLFACMNISYYSRFDGATIATNIETANMMLKTKNNSRKFLYLWDLEWLRRPLDFDDIISVLCHPDINIIARSDSHKNMITNYCNREVAGIVDNWSIGQLEKIIWT